MARPHRLTRVGLRATFDCAALYNALDEQRQARGIGWYELADLLWEQSADLNAERKGDHPLCGGAVQRLRVRDATSCQYALFMLRWLGKAPEEFLLGPVVDVGDVSLPVAALDRRLRWDLERLHSALDRQRRERALTWAELGREIGCTPSRLTNLRSARIADMSLVLGVTQWLRRPAAAFIHPAEW